MADFWWAPVGALIIAAVMLVLNGNFERVSFLWRWAAPARAPEVVLAIIIHEKKVVLVQRKPSPKGVLGWQFPAGQLTESHTDPIDKVKSEVLSETGLVVSVNGEIGRRRHSATRKICAYYSCSYVSGDIRNGDPDENIDVRWVEAREVHAYVGKGVYRKVLKWLQTHG